MDRPSGACLMRSPFLSNVKRKFVVPTSSFIWSKNASLLYENIKTGIVNSSTLSSLAVITGCGSVVTVVSLQS